jgi:membrane protease YdiL (CAAX protease family)
VTSVPPPSGFGSAPPARPELPEGLPPERVPRDMPEPVGRDGWLALPVWVPFAAMLGAVIAILLFGALATGIWLVTDPDADVESTPDGLLIGLTVVQDALLIGAAVLAVMAVLKRATPQMFGFRPVAFGTAVKWMVAAYVAYWVFNVLLLGIFGEPPEQDLVRDLRETQDVAVLIGFGVLTCLVAPVAEEFFFRGFMFSALAGRMGVGAAALVTGAIFGVIHLPGAPLMGVAVLVAFGVALCLLYWRTGSLIPCMALHALNNAISFGFTKSLPAWAMLALIAGSVGLVVLIATALARRGRGAALTTTRSSTARIPPSAGP